MTNNDKVYYIPLKHIEVSELNVRKTSLKTEIEELAESIKKHGLLQPVVLMGRYGNPPYKLIVGKRRYSACKFIKKSKIKAIFTDSKSDLEANIISLIENMQRLELNIADKTEAITNLYKSLGKNVNKVAKELGCSPKTVREYIQIEEQATPKAKVYLKQGKAKKKDIKRVIIASQGDKQKADILLDKIIKLTRTEKDRAVDFGRNNPKASSKKIIEEGKKPKYSPTVVLPITFELENAMQKAQDELQMDRESLAVKALSEWLKEKGFLS